MFLSSFAVFGYLALLSPTLSFILAGSSQHLVLTPTWIAFSMAFCLWSFAGVKFRNLFSRRSSLVVFGILIALSIWLSLFLLSDLQSQINAKLAQSISGENVRRLEQVLYPAEDEFLLRAAIVSALPFFFYGLYLSGLFQKAKAPATSSILSAEFFGLIAGMVGASVLLDEVGSWALSFSVCVFAGFFGAYLGAIQAVGPGGRYRRPLLILAGLAATAAIAAGSHDWLSSLEPRRPLELTLRDFSFSMRVEELDSNWTTYGKVQHLVQHRSTGPRHVAALGGGSGLARVVGSSPFTSAAVQAAKLFPARNTLVLFAGAGADLAGIYEPPPAQMRLTGVELNPRIVALGLDDRISRLGEIGKSGHVQLITAEARTFLEARGEDFDQILFSFAGATVAHYSGAIMHTSQYTLTREAIARAWSRLENGGRLILMPGSKINLLLSLKELERQGHVENLAGSTILFTIGNDENWRRGWDDQVLVVKKGGFQSDEIATVQKNAAGTLLNLVLAPGFSTKPSFSYHRRILDSTSDSSAMADVFEEIRAETGLVFSDFTDDRPFVHLSRAPSDYSSLAAFTGASSFAGAMNRFLSPKVFSLLILALLGFGVLVFTGLFARGRHLSESPRAFAVGLFAASGAVFLGLTSTAVQLLISYKTVLFIGNPTHALAVACVGSAGGSLLGAFWCRRRDLKIQTLISGSLMGAGGLLGFIFLSDLSFIKSALFSTPISIRQTLIVASSLIFSAGFGLAFPMLIRTLQSVRSELLHFAIFIDALACAFCALIGPTFIEDFGLRTFSIATAGIGLAGGVSVALFQTWSRPRSS